MLDFGFASESEIRLELADRLRSQRLLQNISQEDLGLRAGVSLSTVKLLEKKGRCTLENFTRILIALGLVNELQSLFVFKAQSIAMMEQLEKAQRKRASRQARA